MSSLRAESALNQASLWGEENSFNVVVTHVTGPKRNASLEVGLKVAINILCIRILRGRSLRHPSFVAVVHHSFTDIFTYYTV